jgi:hypothetical protein
MMAEYIINKMTKEEEPVLCVHDSFIVPSSLEAKLRKLMDEAFTMVLSTFTALDDTSIARTTTTGMTTDEYYFLTRTASVMSPSMDRDWAFTRLGNLKPGDEDWDFDERMMNHKYTEWEKNYYHDKDTYRHFIRG